MVFVKDALREFATAEATLGRSEAERDRGRVPKNAPSDYGEPRRSAQLRALNNSERLYLRLEQFYGLSGLSANTLLQESYCNSLAISIFLSTALRYECRARFIVLDDVTSSFDSDSTSWSCTGTLFRRQQTHADCKLLCWPMTRCSRSTLTKRRTRAAGGTID